MKIIEFDPFYEFYEFDKFEKEIKDKHQEILNYILFKIKNNYNKKFLECIRGGELNKEFYVKLYKHIELEIYSGYSIIWGYEDNRGYFLLSLEYMERSIKNKKFEFNIKNMKLDEIKTDILNYVDYILE